MHSAEPRSLARLRIDHIGSFLRPESLKIAFQRFGQGALDADGLRAAQDAAIRGDPRRSAA